MFQHHPDPVVREPTTPRPPRPPHVEILDGVARELMPAVWGLGMQCSVLRLPKDLTARERRFVEAVEQNVGRIARVLASVHDLVLADGDGELPLDPRPADMAAICADAVEQLREAGFEDELRVEAEGSGEGAWDPERLSEAISYLLECALHAAPEDDAIRLRWRGGPHDVVLTIERAARPGEGRPGSTSSSAPGSARGPRTASRSPWPGGSCSSTAAPSPASARRARSRTSRSCPGSRPSTTTERAGRAVTAPSRPGLPPWRLGPGARVEARTTDAVVEQHAEDPRRSPERTRCAGVRAALSPRARTEMRRGGAHVNPAFVLIPGAGGVAWYWHRLVPLLEDAGHEAIAVDLPGDDPRAGLSAYAERVVRAIGARRDVVLVAQSLGGFTAPLVSARVHVGMLVFVNAMIPVPGETAGAWWDDTGSGAARVAAARRGGYGTAVDLDTYFLHDVPPEVAAESGALRRPEAEVAFGDRCDFEAWPDVPIRVIAGRDDRFFPLSFQRRVARARLHVAVDAVRGGHLVALSNPRGLADRLLRYLRPPRAKTGTKRPSGASSGTRTASRSRRPTRDRVVGRLRRICMALPAAREQLSHGEPTWFAGTGKVFAMLDDHHHGAPHLSVWLPQPFGAQEALIGADPGRFFRPPYVGPSGWVGVVLDGDPDWRQVAALVREAYLHVAAAKLRGLVRDQREAPEDRV